MVRYYWHPTTGELKYEKTVKQIKRRYGVIPYFVSPAFARAYKIDEAHDLPKERFEGSVPPVGWSKKDVQEVVDLSEEQWKDITKFTVAERIEEYVAKALREIKEEEADLARIRRKARERARKIREIRPSSERVLTDPIFIDIDTFYEGIDQFQEIGDKKSLIAIRQEIKKKVGRSERFHYVKDIIGLLDKMGVLAYTLDPKKRSSKTWQERKQGYIDRHDITRNFDNPDQDRWRTKRRKDGQRYREKAKKKNLEDYL